MNKELFQALHSPIGANAAFAIGYENHGGGFMSESDYVPQQNIYIGYREDRDIHVFPFFKTPEKSQKDSFVKEAREDNYKIHAIDGHEIRRDFEYATDSFVTSSMAFTITNRYSKLGDLERGQESKAKFKTMPGIIGKLVVDNTDGTEDKEAIFAIEGVRRKTFLNEISGGMISGVMSANGYGYAVLNKDLDIREVSDFDFETLYKKDPPSCLMLASLSGILIQVPKGEKLEVDIAFGWFKEFPVTDGGHQYKFYYTNHFNSLKDVLEYTLDHADDLWEEALGNNRRLNEAVLSEQRKFLVSQAAKSYYVSSMLFCEGDELRWIMNEGTFEMMSTFDLLVDHSFFELKYHPWVVRNQLSYYVKEYAYYDDLGISFTHDFGTRRVFTPKGYSSYEIPNITDCFSYMTQEELCNWILVAAMYVDQEADKLFLTEIQETIEECLISMMNRDGKPYDGIMDHDSSRCGTGAEITTYDSLDESLGQARRNLYIAVKCMASYFALATLFKQMGDGYKELMSKAEDQGILCAETVISYVSADGLFPAIIKEDNDTMIIPIIEGLVYTHRLGLMSWMENHEVTSRLIELLKVHINQVLVPKRCLFDDGGWRLSASSNNSWISKIFLCQYIVSDVLSMPMDMNSADKAHENWWKVGCPSNPGIDQIFDGTQEERGFHYPRSVTNTLWW